MCNIYFCLQAADCASMFYLFFPLLMPQALFLGENRLMKLPADLGKLIMLTELDLSSCELVELPDSLSRCTSLIKVWLSNNK